MKIQKILGLILGVVLLAFVTFLILQQSFPKAQARLEASTKEEVSLNKERIQFTAIGDSLTEGVGDETNQGGFVPIVSSSLRENFSLNSIEIENYGVSGERSDQILKRLKEDETIRKNIASSDIITLTVGGNDLMKVIKSNIFGLTVESFKKPLKNYQETLEELLDEMRSLNAQAPIYVVGIYNPFYVNFPEITEMQTIVDNWNEGTETIVDQQEHVFFVPINEVIYKGLEQTTDTTDETTGTKTSGTNGSDLNSVRNDALYERDMFHPNNLGYQLMAKEITSAIVQTSDEWLLKEE